MEALENQHNRVCDLNIRKVAIYERWHPNAEKISWSVLVLRYG
jgi:hypothetical protein